MKKRQSQIDYYMNLPYKIEVERIPLEEGGGFSASIPQLGGNAFLGDGETPEEAIRMLTEVQRDIFTDYIKSGVEIPEPERQDVEYSGKFVVRVPKYLHRELVLEAKRNSVSLNQFVLSLLAKGVENHKWSQKFCQPEPQPLATQKSLRGSKYDFVTSPLKQDPV